MTGSDQFDGTMAQSSNEFAMVSDPKSPLGARRLKLYRSEYESIKPFLSCCILDDDEFHPTGRRTQDPQQQLPCTEVPYRAGLQSEPASLYLPSGPTEAAGRGVEPRPPAKKNRPRPPAQRRKAQAIMP